MPVNALDGRPVGPPSKPIHPRIQSAGVAAAAVTVLVAVLSLAGVTLDSNTADALVIVVAALVPVVAGYSRNVP